MDGELEDLRHVLDSKGMRILESEVEHHRNKKHDRVRE